MKSLRLVIACISLSFHVFANETQFYLCEAAKAMGQATARAYISTELMGEDIGPQRQAIFDYLESARGFMETAESLIVDPWARIRTKNKTIRVAIKRIEDFIDDYDRILPHRRVEKLHAIYGGYLSGFEYTYNSARIDSIQQKSTCDTEILGTCYNYGKAIIASETAGDPNRPRFIGKYQFSANAAMNGTIDDGLWLAMDPGHRKPDGHFEKICCGFGTPENWALFPKFTAESPTVAYSSFELVLGLIITLANPSQECASYREHSVCYASVNQNTSYDNIPPKMENFDCWDTGNPNWYKADFVTRNDCASGNDFEWGASIYLNIGEVNVKWRRKYGEMDIGSLLGTSKKTDYCNPGKEPHTTWTTQMRDTWHEFNYEHNTKAIYVIFKPRDEYVSLGWNYFESLAKHYMKKVEPYALNCDGSQNSDSGLSNHLKSPIPLVFKLENIKFFESGQNIPDQNQRSYTNRFKLSETRFVDWELGISYEKQSQVQEIPIYYIIYNSDHRVFTEGLMPAKISAGWNSSHHADGSGWPEPGKWRPDEYTVHFYAYGQKLAERSFTILEDRSVPDSQTFLNSIKLKSLDFSDEYEFSPIHTNIFEKSKLKYLYWFVEFNHIEARQRLDFPIELSFYKSDGSLIGTQHMNSYVQGNWSSSKHNWSWGWPESGNWPIGLNYAIVRIQGREIGRANFEVY